jgi:hypothetical protein
MALSAPPLDRRDLETILQEVRALAPFYTPEWAVAEDTGAGAALLTIFAGMFEGLLRRLNEMPRKNIIAFLNMLGVQLLPAQPARVPLTFVLSTGAQEAVRIPARSQAAARPPEGGNPIVFETELDFLATAAQLDAIVSVAPERDAIIDHTADVLGEVTAELFADAAPNLQEHSIYFAHSDLFDLKATADITLQFVIEDIGLTAAHFTRDLSWEWWNGDHWVPSTVPGFRETLDAFPAVTALDTELTAQMDAIRVQTDVENDPRFPATGILLIDHEIVTYRGKQGNTFTSVTRGAGAARNVPDASGSVAHAAGAEVRAIDHPFFVRAHVTPLPAGQARLQITLHKVFAAAFATREVSDLESHWIRCRTLRQSVLQTSPLRRFTIDSVRVGTAAAQGVLPDAVFANDVPLDLSAAPLALYPFGRRPRTTDTFYIASDDALSKRGMLIALEVTASIGGIAGMPVETVQGIGPAFAERLRAQRLRTVEELLRLQDRPEQLADILNTNRTRAENILEAAQKAFLDKAEAEAAEAPPLPSDLVLSWEYWNGTGWQILPLRLDTTDSLRRSGTVSFHGPQDIAITSVNGQAHYWIRVRIVGGDYGQETFSLDQNNQVVSSTSAIHPPVLHQLTIRYGVDPDPSAGAGLHMLDHCLTFNNLTFIDRTQAAQSPHASTRFQPFEPPEQANQALYLGFTLPPVKGPISLFLALEVQEYTEANRPRLAWEYLRQPPGTALSEWARLDVVDGTQHLTESGAVAFIGPSDFAEVVRFGRTRFWMRAVNIENPFQSTSLPATPRVKGMHLNTAWAIQAETIQNEILGSSSATVNQTFTLAKFPVVDAVIRVNEKGALSESEQQELLARADLEAEQVTDDAGNVTAFWVRWRPIEDLMAVTATDRLYTIDPTFGQIRFGDGVHGIVPPLGRDNITATYQAGGGTQGNIGVGQITTLRTTIPFVDGVVNPEPAGGGSDTETLDRALERAPQAIKNRGRAVTAEDFEWITREASQAIARVKVLPTFNDRGAYETGWVTIIIVPESQDVRPMPSPQLRRRVAAYLHERAGNIITFPEHVHVTGPTYVEVRVAAELFPTSPDRAPDVETAALEQLRRFLHPLTGGYQGRGWEFGRLPCLSDFYALFEGLDGVDHADRLTITLQDVTPTGEAVGDAQHLTDTSPLDVRMPEHALIYSGNHTLTVRALR